jgi:hypothetical protein
MPGSGAGSSRPPQRLTILNVALLMCGNHHAVVVDLNWNLLALAGRQNSHQDRRSPNSQAADIGPPHNVFLRFCF